MKNNILFLFLCLSFALQAQTKIDLGGGVWGCTGNGLDICDYCPSGSSSSVCYPIINLTKQYWLNPNNTGSNLYIPTSIGDYVFKWSNITDIYLGQYMRSIGNEAFAYCYNLKFISVLWDDPYRTRDGRETSYGKDIFAGLNPLEITLTVPAGKENLYKSHPVWGAFYEADVTGVKLNMESISVEQGKTKTLNYTIIPENVTNKKVTWESSNPNIAAVVNGVVYGINPGYAVITVKTENGNKTATCLVTITAPESDVAYVQSDETGIYPNPASDYLFIKSNTPIEKIEIYNQTGACIMRVANPIDERIDISTIERGVYFVRIYDCENRIETRKAIID